MQKQHGLRKKSFFGLWSFPVLSLHLLTLIYSNLYASKPILHAYYVLLIIKESHGWMKWVQLAERNSSWVFVLFNEERNDGVMLCPLQSSRYMAIHGHSEVSDHRSLFEVLREACCVNPSPCTGTISYSEDAVWRSADRVVHVLILKNEEWKFHFLVSYTT